MKKGILFTTLTLLGAGIIMFGTACAWEKVNSNQKQQVEFEDTFASDSRLIGGDKDAGGCLIGAGYSWCQPKQKCLRIWEESCYEAEEKVIQQILAQKYKKAESAVKITVIQIDGSHARGSVDFEPFKQGGGGLFLAVKNGDDWQVVFDGNGSVNCQELAKYKFSEEMLSGLCD